MEYYLFDDWGIVVNKSSISRALKKTMHISHKVFETQGKGKIAAMQRFMPFGNQRLHGKSTYLSWWVRSKRTKYGFEKGVWDSSIRIITYSYSACKTPQKDGVCYQPTIVDGDISLAYLSRRNFRLLASNGLFLQEEVLPRCTPFPGKNSVIIME